MSALFINGEWVEGLGEYLVSTTPCENKVLWEKRTANPKQTEDAVESAKNAAPLWRQLPLEERHSIARRFSEILKNKQAELAKVISLETGKPLWESTAEVTAMINKVDISIHAQKERAGESANGKLFLSHRPHGVMAVFGAYNFPGHLANGHIVPALIAGNTVVFKPSDLTPYTAEFTVRCWQEAGTPPGVINLLQGNRAVGEALSNADINGLLFTGSSSTGKLIHQQMAGKPEVLLALEMGGNNPLIVGDAKDINSCVNTIINSAFMSAGQRCTCARRLIVVENSQSAELYKQLLDTTKRLIVGRWDDEQEPFLGPLINIVAAKHLLQAQNNLISLGGRSLHAMQATKLGLPFLSPGILDMTEAANVPDEELFGPLLQMYRVNSFDAAIALANNTRYGLAAGLISDSPVEQETFKRDIRAGVITINSPTAGASSSLPFGGVGASGNHRPSAYYAADYSAWPQTLTQGEPTTQQKNTITRGIRQS